MLPERVTAASWLNRLGLGARLWTGDAPLPSVQGRCPGLRHPRGVRRWQREGRLKPGELFVYSGVPLSSTTFADCTVRRDTFSISAAAG